MTDTNPSSSSKPSPTPSPSQHIHNEIIIDDETTPTTTTTTTTMKRSYTNILFADLFEEDKEKKRRITCKGCKADGVALEHCTGVDVSDWGMRHSLLKHAQDEEHIRLRSAFETTSRRKRTKQDKETSSQATTTTTTSNNTTSSGLITTHFSRANAGGTRQALQHATIEFLISHQLPFTLVEDLNKLLNQSCAFGAFTKHDSVALGGRKTLVLEYESHVLPDMVEKIISKHLPAAQRCSVAISWDAKRDVLGRSVTIVLLQTPDGVTPGALTYAGTNRSTGEYKFEMVSPMIDGTYDAYANELNVPEVQPLNKIFQTFSPYISVGMADHASADQNALVKLMDKFGIVPLGDGSHAFTRLADRALTSLGMEVETKLKTLCNTLRSHTVLKESLRASSKLAPARDSSTRFMNILLMGERTLKQKKYILDLFAVSSTTDWAITQPAETQQAVEEAKLIVIDPQFWREVEFVVDFLVPFLKCCRLYDGAHSFNVCFFYKLMSTAAASVKAALEKHKIEKSKCEAVMKAIAKGWNYFHFPLHSFALLFTPQFLEDVREMKRESEGEYKDLRDDALLVAKSLIRRFDSSKLTARKVILSEDDAEVKRVLALFADQLDCHIDGGDKHQTINEFNPDWDPSMIWRIKGFGILKYYVPKVLWVSASTGPNERANFRESRIRNVLRGRLGNARAQGFLLGDMIYNNVEGDRLEFRELFAIYKKLCEYDEEDEKYIDEYEARMSKFVKMDAEEIEAKEEQGIGGGEAEEPAPAPSEPARRTRRRAINNSAFKDYVVSNDVGEDDDDDEWVG
jgi:hypothetical protein